MRNPKSFLLPLIGFAAAFALSLFLAWFSYDMASFEGWLGFLVTILLMAGLGALGFMLVRREQPPTWLKWLVLGAALLRLGLGVFWAYAFPIWGYPNETQQSGYIMFDAFLRDGQAWQLAQSGQPLLDAFRGFTAHDQYGGLLFLSALIYRYLGSSQHTPVLILVLTGTVSALGVLFAWAFARRLWGEAEAKWAAWGLALYPEAVMLGSSQMREAFTPALGVLLVYLLYRYWQERKPADLLIFACVAVFTAALTWSYLAMLALVLGLFLGALLWQKYAPGWSGRTKALVAVGGGAAAVGVGLVGWRLLDKMNDFQGYLTETYSGVVQAILSRTPEVLHTPFIVAYGLLRPLLPAALIGKGSSPLWRGVGIWRAAGWTVVLALLLYATVFVIRKRAWFSPTGALVWGSWLTAAIVSYRAGGDMWDNPRYRAGFAAFQVALCAWALVKQKEEQDPWLRRVLVITGIMVFWIIIWYLPRYVAVPWGTTRTFNMVWAGVATSALYLAWEWLKERRASNAD